MGRRCKFLEFRNVAAGKEALEILANFRMNPTPDQLRAFVVGLFRAAGQLTVASFERESVAGYFRGRRATLDVRLEQKD